MTDHEIGSQLPPGELRFTNQTTFGAFLQEHRERRNISLPHVASRTKISERHLAALERGNIAQWPRGIYRRAMFRAYAAAVGLNPIEMADEFARLFDDCAETPPGRSANAEGIANDRLVAPHRVRVIVSGTALATAGAAFACYGLSISQRATQPDPLVAAAPVAHFEVKGTTGTGSMVTSGEESSALRSSTARAQAVEFRETRTSIESADVEGVLDVTSEPVGAQVTVNGVRWGETPLTIRHLPLGEQRIRVTRDGYVSAERSVQLTRDSSSQILRLDLQVRP